MAGVTIQYELDQNHQASNLLNTELRHINASALKLLSQIIDKDKGWVRLLDQLTRRTLSNNIKEPLANLNLSALAIDLIEQQIYCGKSPTLALLNHWAITGRRRPTVRILLNYLRICKFKWAEKCLCQSILGIDSIEQLFKKESPNAGPQAYSIDDQFKFDNLEELVDSLEIKCQRYSFKSIYKTTNGFCHRPYDPIRQIGTKIGEGRFSSVFRAQSHLELSSFEDSNDSMSETETVAAKLLKSECNKKYLANEINLIGRVQHPNILKLLGIALGESNSNSFNYICLIYPYNQNGSLLDCLTYGLATRNREFLNWSKRIEIAIKVARGISYLHSFHEGPIIHRDIKTANILIDKDLEPKVGDFTLMRQLDSIRGYETQFSQNIIGTSVYMPPEAFRGDISVKFDTFSFGVVLLELITGFKPFNEELDEDLFTHINERLSEIDDEIATNTNNTGESQTTLEEARDKFLSEILDKKAGNWNFESSKVLFRIALKATESRKKDRPEISSILSNLESALPQ